MPLCRDCLRTDIDTAPCPHCGGRVRAHPELFDLTVAHIDADAFYAAVEKRDNPALRERPVIVGAASDRGVVTTACYNARRYGVKSAQPMYRARKACPDAAVIPPRFGRYKEVSGAIRTMLEELTPQVQTVSLDEAFLDLAGTTHLHGAPPAVMLARLARRIEAEIGITVSVGLSHAPFLAKIASDLEKPRGFSVIGRAETLDFLADKPVGLIGGVGPRLQKTLHDLGIRTIGELRRADPAQLARKIGAAAPRLTAHAHGRDSRTIAPNPPAKSLSAETTFARDVHARPDLERAVWPLCEKVSARAKKAGVVGTTVVLKLKAANHQSLTRQAHLDVPTQLGEDLYQTARNLIAKAPGPQAWRLVGIGLADIERAGAVPAQGHLFDDGAARREAAERTLDTIRARFGDKAAFKGRSLK